MQGASLELPVRERANGSHRHATIVPQARTESADQQAPQATLSDSPYLFFIENAFTASPHAYDYLGAYRKKITEGAMVIRAGRVEVIPDMVTWHRDGADSDGNPVTQVKSENGDVITTLMAGTATDGCFYQYVWNAEGYRESEIARHSFYKNGVSHRFFLCRCYDGKGNIVTEASWSG